MQLAHRVADIDELRIFHEGAPERLHVVDGVSFYVPPESICIIDAVSELEGVGADSFEPIAIVNDGDLEEQWRLLQEDDVVQPAFFNRKLRHGTLKVEIPIGPYFVKRQSDAKLSVNHAYRVYADTQNAFFYGIAPTYDKERPFRSLNIRLDDGTTGVAVPSRLYSVKTPSKPLAGVRITVKDIIDIKGLKTSQGSRAWLALYPAANQHANCIQRLIDLGAVIVGKTRNSQFANGQYGGFDYADFKTPWNAQGDGHQDPSSSSSGAGAAACAYDWLDLHLGSDTGGSVRAPAAVNGAFGLRPSHAILSLSGVLPVCEEFDTLGLLSRHPDQLCAHVLPFYGCAPRSLQRPARLLYLTEDPETSFDSPPGFFPAFAELQPIYEAFVKLLERVLDTERNVFEFYKEHKKKFGDYPPALLGPIWTDLTAADQWTNIGKQFFQDYSSKFGSPPVLDPPVMRNLEYGSTICSNARAEHLKRKGTFADWINMEVLADRNTFMVFPSSQGVPCYREGPGRISPVYFGWNRFGISQLAGVPEIVLTIGQVAFQSAITGKEAQLPLSVSIVGPKGSEPELIDIIKKLDLENALFHPKSNGNRSALVRQ